MCSHWTLAQIIIKTFLRSPSAWAASSQTRFLTPTLQRVNHSGNICEASRFDSINHRASSVKQHSHDALISLWSAIFCHHLSLFQHKQTAQGVNHPVWQVCGSETSFYASIKWCRGSGIKIIWAIYPANVFWVFCFSFMQIYTVCRVCVSIAFEPQLAVWRMHFRVSYPL